MALNTVSDYQLFLNQVFYALGAEDQGYYWDLIVRRGGAAQADVNTVKADFAAYFPTRTTRGTNTHDANPLPIQAKFANGQ
jgi:hypothetical protein